MHEFPGRRVYLENDNVAKYFWHWRISPVNLLHIFRTTFPKNTSGQLLLKLQKYCFHHIRFVYNIFNDFALSRIPVVILDKWAISKCRSSRLHMFFKIDVLKNYANFTGKHLCWSPFLIKKETPKKRNLKRDYNTSVFLCHLRNL